MPAVGESGGGLRASFGLSDAEVEVRHKAKALFEEFDKDHNGVIDKTEFDALYESLREAGVCSGDKEAVLKGLDTDHNGLVSLNEYVQWFVRLDRMKANDVD
eukprot:TRINITY_DN733_c0_g1_i4.p3 TRINITY_DN733_c0_g1~~TRINITY_DN733_c0_g1_i4.p3  ORF type:complete len:102 (+),score=35.26 TRINITY_DN733_c0_g1_i4:234-539(+)